MALLAFLCLCLSFLHLHHALQYDYDVFLSFRGNDTRFSFVGHLYSALRKAQIRTFRDDKSISDGEHIEREIIRAIYRSRASIVVLSKDFASSPYCLDEVVMFMERREPFGHIVLPVFYHVDPFDVGHQTGTYGDAFDKHERLNKGRMHRVEKWRKALNQIAELKGLVYGGERGEHEFIQDIVQSIQKKLNHADPTVFANSITWREVLFIPMGGFLLVWLLSVFQNQLWQAIGRLMRYVF